MSKAFVNDDQAASDVRRPLPVGRRPVTPAGAAHLRALLRALAEEELPKLRAASARSEPEAVRALEQAQRRAAELERILELSDIAPLPPEQPERVMLGTKVFVRNEDNDEQLVYTLVGPDEVDGASRRVSHLSPVGRALMGRRVGERIFIKRPAGTLEAIIERIAQP